MLDKTMVGRGQSVTMDTVIFLVTLVLTNERTILQISSIFHINCFCVLAIILNSVMEQHPVLLINCYNCHFINSTYSQYYHNRLQLAS